MSRGFKKDDNYSQASESIQSVSKAEIKAINSPDMIIEEETHAGVSPIKTKLDGKINVKRKISSISTKFRLEENNQLMSSIISKFQTLNLSSDISGKESKERPKTSVRKN